MGLIYFIIIEILIFIGMVFFLRKMMASSSAEESERLQAMSQELIKKSQDVEFKIKEAEAQAKMKMEAADDEIRKLKAKMAQDAERIKDEATAKARQEVDRIIQQAMNTKDAIRAEIIAEQTERMVDEAVKLIKQVLSPKNLSATHQGLIQELIEQLGILDLSKLQIQADRGELMTASSVDAADKAKIISVLSSKIGRTIDLTDVSSPNLIAGVSIKLGSFIIDGSLEKRLKESAAKMKKG